MHKKYSRIKQKLIDRLSDGDANWLGNLANAYSDNDEHASKILSYFEKSWFFVSSPMAVNVPVSNKKFTGLPISCYLISVGPDSSKWPSILRECEYISVHGGGIGIDFSEYYEYDILEKIRELGTHVNGLISKARFKASMAAYLRVDNPHIEEFIALRDLKSNTDPKRFIHHGVTLTDEFMESVRQDKSWNLLNSKGEIVKTLSARSLLTSIITTRSQTGEPYILFVDTANKTQPECYKKLNRPVKVSNLCTEIVLPTDADYLTAICCLCSLNINKYDEWKMEPDFIPSVVRFMDNVMTYFIIMGPLLAMNDLMSFNSLYIGRSFKPFEKALYEYIKYDPINNIGHESHDAINELGLDVLKRICDGETDVSLIQDFIKCVKAHPMRKAFISALLGRDIGIGGCGYSSLLQMHNIPIESERAFTVFDEVQTLIQKETRQMNTILAQELGQCGAGFQTNIPIRFANMTAIAPTTMISQYCECSPCTEVQELVCRLKTGYDSCTIYNPLISEKLDEHHLNNMDTWIALSNNNLSVLKDIVPNPDVFKGPYFVDYDKCIRLYSKTICSKLDQSMSFNLHYTGDITLSEMIKHVMLAWKSGMKTLYYTRSKPALSISDTLNVCEGCQ
jgi:ribonucleotide reductase alpha subunit